MIVTLKQKLSTWVIVQQWQNSQFHLIQPFLHLFYLSCCLSNLVGETLSLSVFPFLAISWSLRITARSSRPATNTSEFILDFISAVKDSEICSLLAQCFGSAAAGRLVVFGTEVDHHTHMALVISDSVIPHESTSRPQRASFMPECVLPGLFCPVCPQPAFCFSGVECKAEFRPSTESPTLLCFAWRVCFWIPLPEPRNVSFCELCIF